MNAEMSVLQALDAAQEALRGIAEAPGAERKRLAHDALQQVANAPWSSVMRASEAEQHGWLSQMREALQRLELAPESEGVERLIEEGLWAADELERDLRSFVGAR
jgi:hypothetical protein